jgi:hypothetical protein
MPNPQQPELARSRRSAVTAEEAPTAGSGRRARGKRSGAGPDPVPEENLPGHRPGRDQDKPDPRRLPPGTVRHFPFAFERAQLLAGLPFGVTPLTTGVMVDHERLHVRYGPWSLTTPLANIAGTTETGPYQLLKIAGPAHLSLADQGVAFCTRRTDGLCIEFHEPVGAIAPFGIVRHPAATVTVVDRDGLRRLLEVTD